MKPHVGRLALAGLAFMLIGGGAWAAPGPEAMVEQGYVLMATDPDAALRLFETAAASGSAKALNALGNYWNGESPLRRDPKRARGYYEKAEAAGYLPGSLNIGEMDWYDEDPARQAAGCDRMQTVMEAGSAAAEDRVSARAMLGQCYVYGVGRAKDVDRGLQMLEQADRQGDVDGETLRLLGHSWYSGWGSREADAKAAFAYYRRAADRGDDEGAWYAGMALIEGEGAAKDAAAGRGYIEKSAQAGYVAAQISMGVMLATGEGGAEDDAEARLWYLSAAEQGSAHAMRALGAMLVQGEGGAIDTVSAVALLELAQGAGDEAATEFIGQARETTVPERMRIERLKTAWLQRHGPPVTDDALLGLEFEFEPERIPT